MSVDLVTQKALRARLISTQAVTDLVPSVNILDRHMRPADHPTIVLGETQLIDDASDMARRRTRVFHTIHVFAREVSLEGAKRICGAVRSALHFSRLQLDAGFHAADVKVSSMRFVRDPDLETSHGIVTVEMLVLEEA